MSHRRKTRTIVTKTGRRFKVTSSFKLTPGSGARFVSNGSSSRSSRGGGSRISVVSNAPEDKGLRFAGIKIETSKQFKTRTRRRRSSGGGGLGRLKPTIRADTISIGGTVITGFTNIKTGEFSPSGKEASNVANFRAVQRSFGTSNTSKIRQIAQQKNVKVQLDKLKAQQRAKEIAQTKQQISSAQQRAKLQKQVNVLINSKQRLTFRDLNKKFGNDIANQILAIREGRTKAKVIKFGRPKPKKEIKSKQSLIKVPFVPISARQQLQQQQTTNTKIKNLITKIRNKKVPISTRRKILNQIGLKLDKNARGLNNVAEDLSNQLFKIRRIPIEKRTAKQEFLIQGLGISSTGIRVFNKIPKIALNFIDSIITPEETLGSILSIFTDPKVREQISLAGAKFGAKIQRGDPEALATYISELLVQLGLLGKISKIKKLRKLLPKFVKLKDGEFQIRKVPKEKFKVKGKERFLKERIEKPSFKKPFKSVIDFLKGKKPGQFRKFTKNPGLILKTSTVQSGKTPLSKQVLLAGKEITAVNAGKNQITNFLKRKVIIRKPIPGEDKFPLHIKKMLNKFDNGNNLNEKEFVKVNLWLQKNVASNITLLERSLYADPKSSIRLSRLQIDTGRDATLKDILKGNFKLFNLDKPQVLIFENAKVAKFPKRLKDIERKLKKDIKLNLKETFRLISWQVKTGSGKFKPIGSTIYKGGIELEVTLAPGEFVKRIKKIGFTIIKGKKVNFVSAEIWKPPKNILKRIKKANKGEITEEELLKLEKELSKKLGTDIIIDSPIKRKITRRINNNRPVLRFRLKGIKVLRKTEIRKPTLRKSTLRKPTPRKPTLRKPTPRKPTLRKPTPRKPTLRKPTLRKLTPRKSTLRKPTLRKPTLRKSTLRKPTPRKSTLRKPIPRKPTPRKPTPRKPIIIPPFTLKSKLPKGQRLAFDFLFRSKGKIRRVKAGLPLNKALNKAGLLIDNTLSRSMQLVISGTTKTKDIKKPSILKKFRTRKGKKALVLVEKTKNILDTKGEKRGITLAKRLKIKPIKSKIRNKKIKKVKKPIRKKKAVKNKHKKK